MSQTIIARMYQHTINQPDDVAFRFLNDSGEHSPALTYGQLWDDAAQIARFLQSKTDPGNRVMLFYPPGLDYIKAFYGCLMAGMIAVPLYPPRRNAKSDRVVKIAQCCHAQIALTTESVLPTVEALWQQQNDVAHLPLTFFATDNPAVIASNNPLKRELLPVDLTPDTVAFLQYTSGSTGAPKGVIITHQNITGNIEHLTLMGNSNRDDVFVNWLPLFHDLGLVTAVLMPVYLGATSVLMPPASFIRHPMVWLKAIEHYRGTVCGSPNFAYDLCVEKMNDVAGLDLSSWRVAFNAAEPVHADTLAQFTIRFAPCGFQASSFYPSYGMAESTAFITGGHPVDEVPILFVDKQQLLEGRVVLSEQLSQHSTAFVGCGGAQAPHDLRIVDGDSRVEKAEGELGEIWFAGPSVSPGYWQLPELTAESFDQSLTGSDKRYLRSGDLGFVWQGELFVTGRIKDLIIVRGKNYYPQDIEQSVFGAHPAIRARHCAAFSLGDDAVQEQLVIVAELARTFVRTVNYDEVSSAIRQQVFDDHQIIAKQVVLTAPGNVPMTSSGKIQRRKTRQLLNEGDIRILGEASSTEVRELVEPQNEFEQAVYDIWCRELKLEQLSTADRFFDVGGNSLVAIAISAAIGKQFTAIRLDSEQLVEHPTVAQMAAFIELKTLHAQNTQRRKAIDTGVSTGAGKKRTTLRI